MSARLRRTTASRRRARAARLNVLVVNALMLASPVHSGPPLVADDPHTVGAGILEPILSVSAFDMGRFTTLAAPTLDLTLGLRDDLDATLVANPVIELERGDSAADSIGKRSTGRTCSWGPVRV